MLADVRRLRLEGSQLPRERIHALAPVRGELIVFKRTDPWRGGNGASRFAGCR